MKLVTADEMRAIEQRAFDSGVSPSALMETAGRAVANAVVEHLGSGRGRRIVVLVGPGNNGGDGLVAARHLEAAGAEVTVYLLTKRPDGDPNLAALKRLDITVVELRSIDEFFRDSVVRADAIVEAILGIGRQRPLEGLVAEALEALKARKGPLFAVDLPAGLDADTGATDSRSVGADVTLTLGLSKLGLHVSGGPSHAGRVQVLDLGLDPIFAADVPIELLTPEWVRDHLPGRASDSNKGTFGRVMVVAGSERYPGAASLASLGALRAGAGLVTLTSIYAVRAVVAAFLPEVTHLPLSGDFTESDKSALEGILTNLREYDCLLIGPGLGQSDRTDMLVEGLMAGERTPKVIDADALNSIARIRAWPDLIKGVAVLTPHPGELARLMQTSVADVQADRIASARKAAASAGQIVALKGANTVVAAPDGRVLLSPFATAILASAGTGDVLAGAIAGLIAQGVEPFVAAGLGVYLHGAAGAEFETEYGPSGLLASELGAKIAVIAARIRQGA